MELAAFSLDPVLNWAPFEDLMRADSSFLFSDKICRPDDRKKFDLSFTSVMISSWHSNNSKLCCPSLKLLPSIAKYYQRLLKLSPYDAKTPLRLLPVFQSSWLPFLGFEGVWGWLCTAHNTQCYGCSHVIIRSWDSLIVIVSEFSKIVLQVVSPYTERSRLSSEHFFFYSIGNRAG